MGKKHTQDFFVEKVEKLFGKDEYTILGKYINYGTKVLVKHNICGYEWNVSAGNFLSSKSKCPLCNKKVRYTIDLFKERVYGMVGDEYSVLSDECLTCLTFVKMKHNVCGFEWDVSAQKIIVTKTRCPFCAGLATYTTERFKEKVLEIAGDSYSVQGEYVNTNTEIEILHKDCEKIFSVTPQRFMHSNSRCPLCPSQFTGSIGEIKINTFLVENNILFKREYYFDKCRNIKPLPFDFAIFNRYRKLKFLIEFDGGQHYKPVDLFGGEKAFEKMKINDEIKNEYCRIKNIRLIRIPYWDFNNIDKILTKLFKIKK